MNKVIVVILGVLITLTFCAQKKEQETGLQTPQDQEVRQYSDPIVDNLLLGLNEGNYQKFSKNFDGQMKSALNSNAFVQTRQKIVERIGNYVSKRFLKIEEKGEFVAVIYTAEFEREKGVTVRVVFRKGDEKHQVTGLWFDSPKLRG